MNHSITEKTPVFAPAYSRTLITYASFFSFFLFGFIDNLKGPTLPVLLQELHFRYALGGTIILGAYLGFLVATLLTGPLADIAGRKTVMFIVCACFAAGIIGYSSFSLFWLLAAAMTVIGLGLGSVEVGANLIIIDIYREQKGKYLNMLAFFHGVGSMVAPLYAGWLLASGISWRSVYQSALVPVLVLLVAFLSIKYPKTQVNGGSKFDLKRIGKSAFTGTMLLYYLVIIMYVAAEIGIGTWLVEFLQQAKSQTLLTSSLFLSLFFGAITVGRFLGSFLVERIGYVKIMLFASVAAVVCLSIGTFGPPPFAFCLPLSGLFFSIMFPTTTAAVSDLHSENVGTIMGLLFGFAGLGGMLGPWAVGVCSDWLGIGAGFSVNVMFYVIICAALGLLRTTGKMINKNQ